MCTVLTIRICVIQLAGPNLVYRKNYEYIVKPKDSAECRQTTLRVWVSLGTRLAAHVLGPPPSRGGDLELEGGVSVSL